MTVHDVAAALPAIPDLLRLCRSIAMAEAVLNRGAHRYYSFDTAWSASAEVFAMRNGSGDEFDTCSRPQGCSSVVSTTSRR